MCLLDVVSLEEKAWFYLLSNYDVTTSVTLSRRSTAHLCCVYTIGCCFGRIRHFLHHLWCTFLFLFFNQNLLSLAPWPTPVFSEVSQRGSQVSNQLPCHVVLFIKNTLCLCPRTEELTLQGNKRTKKDFDVFNF